jgi:hypothetical protein
MAPAFSTSWQDPSDPQGQLLCPDLGPGQLPSSAWLDIRIGLRLSERELGVVRGIFADQEQESIATAMGIAPAVVYRTLMRVYVKLHIGSRIELKSRVKAEYLAIAANQARSHGAGSV